MDERIGAVVVFVVLFGVCSLTVGHLLRTNGIVFLEQVFGTENGVAEATNALLSIGYYLLCLSLLCFNAGAVAESSPPQMRSSQSLCALGARSSSSRSSTSSTWSSSRRFSAGV